MPWEPFFYLAPHQACDSVEVLLTHLMIDHREPQGSKETSSIEKQLFIVTADM